MIEIFDHVLRFFTSIIDIILAPIDAVISTVIPSFSDISTNISNLLSYFYDTFLFIFQWIHLPSGVINLILGYIAFKVTVYASTLGVKLFLRWYRTIRGN